MSAALVYNDVAIREVEGRTCLTDMWKAADEPANLRPSEWLRQERTQRLLAQLQVEIRGTKPDMGRNHIGLVETRKGGATGGGTIAEFKVALAYAADLSPEFHSWMLDVAAERLRGTPVPPPALAFDEERLATLIVRYVDAALDRRAANDGVFDGPRGRRISKSLADSARRQAKLDDDAAAWRRHQRLFMTEVRDVAELPSTGSWAMMPLSKFARTWAAVVAIAKRVERAEEAAAAKEPARQLTLLPAGGDAGRAA